MVASGKVQIDGRDELRKTCKLRPGQVVGVHGTRVRIHAAPVPAARHGGADPPG
jgi:ribosome-associated protein